MKMLFSSATSSRLPSKVIYNTLNTRHTQHTTRHATAKKYLINKKKRINNAEMTNERRRRRWHWLACLVAAWSLVFLSIALCEAEQIRPASPSGSQHHHHSDCHSLRPRLTVQKHLLPATHLDSRDRR